MAAQKFVTCPDCHAKIVNPTIEHERMCNGCGKVLAPNELAIEATLEPQGGKVLFDGAEHEPGRRKKVLWCEQCANKAPIAVAKAPVKTVEPAPV